jgi:hypothetical protein
VKYDEPWAWPDPYRLEFKKSLSEIKHYWNAEVICDDRTKPELEALLKVLRSSYGKA